MSEVKSKIIETQIDADYRKVACAGSTGNDKRILAGTRENNDKRKKNTVKHCVTL